MVCFRFVFLFIGMVIIMYLNMEFMAISEIVSSEVEDKRKLRPQLKTLKPQKDCYEELTWSHVRAQNSSIT